MFAENLSNLCWPWEEVRLQVLVSIVLFCSVTDTVDGIDSGIWFWIFKAYNSIGSFINSQILLSASHLRVFNCWSRMLSLLLGRFGASRIKLSKVSFLPLVRINHLIISGLSWPNPHIDFNCSSHFCVWTLKSNYTYG